MTRNAGERPEETIGKRVVVRLRNGHVCGREPVGSGLPAGWAAITTRWTLEGLPHDVVGWELVG